jgi:hypothetical protein
MRLKAAATPQTAGRPCPACSRYLRCRSSRCACVGGCWVCFLFICDSLLGIVAVFAAIGPCAVAATATRAPPPPSRSFSASMRCPRACLGTGSAPPCGPATWCLSSSTRPWTPYGCPPCCPCRPWVRGADTTACHVRGGAVLSRAMCGGAVLSRAVRGGAVRLVSRTRRRLPCARPHCVCASSRARHCGAPVLPPSTPTHTGVFARGAVAVCGVWVVGAGAFVASYKFHMRVLLCCAVLCCARRGPSHDPAVLAAGDHQGGRRAAAQPPSRVGGGCGAGVPAGRCG